MPHAACHVGTGPPPVYSTAGEIRRRPGGAARRGRPFRAPRLPESGHLVQPPVSPESEPATSAAQGRAWRAWLGVAISAAFLVIAFRGQHPADVLAVLRQVQLGWLPPALALFAAGVLIRAVRWSILLRPVAPLSAGDVLPALLAGYTANNILPLRTGEVVRAYLLGGRYGLRKSAVLGTIAVERLFDGLTMLGFLLAAMTAISPTPELRRLALLAALLFAVAIGALLAVLLAGERRDRIVRLLLSPLPPGMSERIGSIAAAFLDGLGALTRGRDLVPVAITSILAWACEAAMYWTIARGFGPPLSAAIDVPGAILTTGVANLATLVPAAPGYVGTFEAGVLLAVSGGLGVPRAVALSYALLVHAALWFPVTVVGAWCWWKLARSPRAGA